MAHILDLPKEILVIIFNNMLTDMTQNEFYSVLSKVCTVWKSILEDCYFWKKFDGSLGSRTLHSFSIKGYLVKIEELKFSRFSNLKHSKYLEDIFAGMPNLKSVNFSNIPQMHPNVLMCLHDHCKKVCALKFSDDISFPKYKISDDYLNEFLTLQGKMLLVIDLSNLELKGITKIFHAIAKSCPNLEELLVQNIISAGGLPIFPLKTIQEGCNKIKNLRLGYPISFTQHGRNKLPGFPMLEVFTYPNKSVCRFSENDFINILSKSPGLKVLDIRGCHFISADAILSLPATHIENLYISGTRLVTTKKLNEILTRWLKSLSVIDISKMPLEYINEMLTDLCTNGRMDNLEYLDLNNTKVAIKTVIHLIENCEKLKTLNLLSCRSVGRGYMREYRDKTEIDALHSKLLGQIEVKIID